MAPRARSYRSLTVFPLEAPSPKRAVKFCGSNNSLLQAAVCFIRGSTTIPGSRSVLHLARDSVTINGAELAPGVFRGSTSFTPLSRDAVLALVFSGAHGLWTPDRCTHGLPPRSSHVTLSRRRELPFPRGSESSILSSPRKYDTVPIRCTHRDPPAVGLSSSYKRTFFP